ncbi:MAG: 8-amino-7-oxononanoate synthase [Magnetococcales bacterium]|nr:8-amino-7-oxononanoate synthase [Magnetococcales bacterium]MBF0322581.1 8-amino-7-oxononanoate synthase [Magnetococcales bacterium]
MPYTSYRAFIQHRQKADQLRALRSIIPLPGGRVQVNGQELVNFSANDYLGLAEHPELIQRSQSWAARWGAGSRASRLVSGNLEMFAGVEQKLASGKRSPSALLFNSGYQANVAILGALLDPHILGAQPLVFSDRLNHASIHHGCRAAGVRQIRYRHADLNHLEDLLNQHRDKPGPRFILSETVFSMDGDQVDVAGLVALKNRHNAFLYLDEAHATGVLGPDGFGLSAAFPGQVDLAMGTFSKGLGSFGAYAACSRELVDFLVNHCGGLIYATALPPAVLGAMDAALDLLPTMAPLRQQLLARATHLRQVFRAAGLDTGLSSTQIIPLITGSATQALLLSRRLEASGMLAVAIRPPTVPVGSSRIRFSLSAAHLETDLANLEAMAPVMARIRHESSP